MPMTVMDMTKVILRITLTVMLQAAFIIMRKLFIKAWIIVTDWTDMYIVTYAAKLSSFHKWIYMYKIIVFV